MDHQAGGDALTTFEHEVMNLEIWVPCPRRCVGMRAFRFSMPTQSRGHGTRAFFIVLAMILGSTTAADPPNHQVQLNGQTFTLPVGFTIECVAGPPLVNRPIVADFDEDGRLYVADSSGSNDPVKVQLEKKPHRIVRLEDTKGNGHFDKATVFADKMMFTEG